MSAIPQARKDAILAKMLAKDCDVKQIGETSVLIDENIRWFTV